MRFEDFIKRGLVRRGSQDFNLAKSLIKTAESDLKFLSKLKIDKNSSRKIMSNYYDVLRSILEAISAWEGYKIYSHEAFAYFLKEKGEENLSLKFDRFRQVRNKINYYGEDISVEETEANILEIKNMVQELKKKYFKNLK
ncbi:hypothetical protein HN832_03855 [archaeon]|jgi:hypothetical protein|nr:hypothetical protein [archaeon]MBT4373471.1 hypothetical protein [archaeon]MBT4531919.1 hypothetical protein [archaeon]MBT7001586.1 hypothetical protein [archaeon]MBT7282522.1 hypothetical protein [archaeon]